MVLALVAVLLTLAVPGFEAIIQKQKIGIAANDLFAAITLARSEAIRRNARVDLVPADGADWASGWVILVASDAPNPMFGNAKIIHTHAPVASGITIKSVMRDSSKPYIAFIGSGRTRINANSQTPQAGHIGFSLGLLQRRIILNFLGRPRLCNPVTERACG